jgi:hypothetical protein
MAFGKQMRGIPSFLVALLFACLAYGQIELQRMLMNITTGNGSEFVLHHDIHDTRLYLSTPSPLDDERTVRFTMVVHSRDKLALKVDVIRFRAGMAEEHYDISDMASKMVRPVTAEVINSLEALCPDIHFVCKAIKEAGLRKTTQLRRRIPEKVRRLLPAFPTTYERVVYSAMSPFFIQLQSQIPKRFEMVPRGTLAKKAAEDAPPPTFSFSLSGHDRAGRAASMQTSFGTEGIRMAIQSHHASVRDLYNDESYLK